MLARLMFLQFFAISPTVRGMSEFRRISNIFWRGFVRRRLWRSNISFSIVLRIVYNLLQQVCNRLTDRVIHKDILVDFCDVRVGYDVFGLAINDFLRQFTLDD